MPPQALQIIFEVQFQRSSQKRAGKKIRFFELQNFFFFILTPPTSSVHNFLICLVQIERFKLLWNRHLKLYKSSSNSKGNKLIFKSFLRGSKIGYELFSGISFLQQPPLLWETVTFLPPVHFCQFWGREMCQEEGSI